MLQDHLNGKTYNSEESMAWTDAICSDIKTKLKGVFLVHSSRLKLFSGSARIAPPSTFV